MEIAMAHALEIGNNGEVAFALRGEPAWHGLASVLFDADQHVTTNEMLESAYLNNWNVRLEDLTMPEGYRNTSENQLVVRDNPFDSGVDVLSVVGSRYKVVQNEELFAFGDGILDGGATWESAGSIKGGKVVFGSLVVPREFIIDPEGANDKTVTYLLVHTSHDGSTAVQANITPVRVVCQNTLNMAIKDSKQSFKIRHTATVGGRIDEARRVLGLTFDHMDNFEIMAKQLYETAMTDQQFNDIIKAIYAEPDNSSAKVAQTRWNDKVDLLNNLWDNSPTNATIKNTAWGALNTMTERIDYFRTGRKGGEAMIGAASGFDPVVNAEKARILGAIMEFAK
jgi:phage/plasmid-like protein (TIGR03299 family)